MRKSLLLTFCFSFLVAQISFADYMPLLGSRWAEENPNSLPYSECVIANLSSSKLDDRNSWAKLFRPQFNADGSWDAPLIEHSLQGGLLVGGSTISNSGMWGHIFIACISPRFELAYAIPVHMSNITNLLEFGTVRHALPLKFDSQGLNYKTVSELFQNYNGKIIGAGWGLTKRKAKYTQLLRFNNHPITVTMNIPWSSKNQDYSANILPNLVFGFSRFYLREVQNKNNDSGAWSIKDHFTNPYVLTSGTNPLEVLPETELYHEKWRDTYWIKRSNNEFIRAPRAFSRYSSYENDRRIYTTTEVDDELVFHPTENFAIDLDGVNGTQFSLFQDFDRQRFLVSKKGTHLYYHYQDRVAAFRQVDEELDYMSMGQLEFLHEASIRLHAIGQ